ncbi:glutathione S-transferase family protein [Novosphingobium sp. AAP83]|uniref:glutathione S-transferase family protein n=1 Tax=Novosphingobium sp. AAP83 TaxID=1523425 RepID=UPI000AE851F9|nr:glutathione S-transferase family protein [Novosphingobium sp. AAP83]
MLDIYHWEPNANSGKPLLAALEKGVEFQSHYIDMLAFDQHKPDYLVINPAGTIPAMVHNATLIFESTYMIDYIDMAFEGPALRPADPYELWRMRWWCRFFDQYVGPATSQLGWSSFVGPMVRERDEEELKAAIERIPLKERRMAWSKAIYGTFTEEELAESRARLMSGIAQIDEALTDHDAIAGDQFSIADLAGFMMLFGLPVMFPEAANDERTPNFMSWLRRTARRPSVQEGLSIGKNPRFAQRFQELLNGEGISDA